jgi:hypothetical protein
MIEDIYGGANVNSAPDLIDKFEVSGLPPFMEFRPDPFTPTVLQLWGKPGFNDARVAPYIVTITLHRADGTTSTGQYILHVDNVNQAPAFTEVVAGAVTTPVGGGAVSITTPEGTAPIAAVAADPDMNDLVFPDHLTYALGDTGGLPITIDPSTGTITPTSRLNAGVYLVKVSVTDDHGAVATLDISWTITDVNRPPTISVPLIPSRLVGTPLTFAATASDLDGDSLTFSTGAGWPAGFTLNPSTGVVTGTSLIGGTIYFPIVVSDGRGGSAAATASAVFVTNRPPVCSAATPSVAILWPPNHKMVPITINGVTDPEGKKVTIRITSIFQDEPTSTRGDGDKSPDGGGVGTSTAQVRAERTGNTSIPGDGRVYHIYFTATDVEGATCTGEVRVGVPHDQGGHDMPIDGGALYNSLIPTPGGGHYAGDGDDHDRKVNGHFDGDGCEHDRARSRR